MHNKLRRDIMEALGMPPYTGGFDTHPPYEALLQRALSALGGPVQDNRPQVVTSSVTPSDEKVALVKGLIERAFYPRRDPGDEDESEYQSGLGAPLPQDEPRVEELGSLASDTKTPLA